MGDVLTFTLRPKPAAPEIPEPLAGATLRASLEKAAQIALDAADRIIAVLDHMDGDADHEDGGDAEPSLAAPENATGSQVVYMRGADDNRETEVPEAALPEVAAKNPGAVILFPVIPWGGKGNVLTAATIALFEMAIGLPQLWETDRCG